MTPVIVGEGQKKKASPKASLFCFYFKPD